MPKSDFWTLMNMSKDDVYKHFIPTRRWILNGFQLDPRFHKNGKVALATPNQSVLVDVNTGDFALLENADA